MTAPVSSGRWSDLGPRVISAVAMMALGAVEIWLGGRSFHIFVGVIIGLMLWELVRMVRPDGRQMAIVVGVLGALATAFILEFNAWLSLLVMLGMLILLGVVLGIMAGHRRRMGMAYACLILLGGLSLLVVRDNLGIGWIAWLIGVVIASDVAGYFAGKTFGGPKFWPAISPKKTWSGTVAGWVGAAVVGYVFSLGSGVTIQVVILSLVLAFAAQMGDIAESAIKRRTGVKDSSALIPGHGGVLDRFDGLLGAAVALLIIAAIFGFPEGLIR